jgi:tether containing UBX domain for GLUT4
MQKGTPDSGRLYYEMPVINMLGRELASFTDLQKTLVQLGVTSGSVLLRLDFRNSGKPLEQAMADISEYFQPSGEVDSAVAQAQENVGPANSAPTEGATVEQVSPDSDQISNKAEPAATEETPQSQGSEAEPTQVSHHPPVIQQPTTPESPSRAVKIFLAPNVSTSPAAIQHHDESDYIPTIEQAKQHLARLNNAGRNQRLLSDAELAQQEANRKARLNAVQRVNVRIRLPDQTSVETEFSNYDSGNDVYNFIRKLMTNGGVDFSLRYVNSKGTHVTLRDGPQKLIAENGWTGNILVTLVWGESVPTHVRQQPVLKDETRRQAVPIAVASPAPEEKSKQTSGGFFGKPQNRDGDKQKSVEAKLKNFLGLGKRK